MLCTDISNNLSPIYNCQTFFTEFFKISIELFLSSKNELVENYSVNL